MATEHPKERTWLEEYLASGKQMPEDDLIFPSEPVDPTNDNIVGSMTLYHQRLYTLLQRLCEAADQSTLKAKYPKRGG